MPRQTSLALPLSRSQTVTRRRWVAAAGAGLGLGALAACGAPAGSSKPAGTASEAQSAQTGAPTAKPTGKIVLLDSQLSTDLAKQRWAEHKQRFEAQFPGATVEDLRVTDMKQLVALESAGTPPDVARPRRQAEFPPLVMRNALVDLLPYLTKSGSLKKADFYESTLETNSVGGKLLMLPETIGMFGLFFNKQLFDERGVKYPDLNGDYDTDLMGAAEKLTKRDGDRILQAGLEMPRWWYLHYAFAKGQGQWQGGPTQPGVCAKSTLSAPAFVKAVQWVQDHHCTARVGVYGDDAKDAGLLFEGGKVAMQLEGSGMVSTYADRIKDTFKWDFVLMPLGEKGKPRVQSMVPGGISLFAASKAKDLGWAFIEFSNAPEYLLQTVKTQGARDVYANRRVQESPEYNASPVPPVDKKVWVEGLKAGRFFPEAQWEMRGLGVPDPELPSGSNFNDALQCGADPKQIITAIDSIYNGALKARGVPTCG